jgi:hypothetical protein
MLSGNSNTGRIRALLRALLTAALLTAGSVRAAPPAPTSAGSGVPMNAVDLRPVFKNWGLEVRSQGARNTCSAFVVTDALEYAVASQRRSGTHFSVEFLNWAANQALGQAEDGGYFSDLWTGFTAYGTCPEEDLPYQAGFDPKLRPSDDALRHAQPLRDVGLRLHWIKPWDVTTGLSDAQLIEIKRVLCRQWPVCGGFRWPKEERWQNDILEMASPEGVRDGHSVLLVGFRDDPMQPGGGVFIFRNTSKRARDGFMTYEYARAYMNDGVWIDSETAATTKPAARLTGALLGPLGAAPTGRNRRVSSNQQPEWHSENLDMTWLQPGESVEMPLLEGPGVITHMWFTSHAGWVGELNALSLRIYWDRRKEPGVEAPLGDFFAVGQGKPAVVESVPVQVSPTGALSCYWRMPFRESARIVVTNDNPDRGAGLYWQVDWTQVDAVPPETPYFHARYRQEYPATMGQDYMIADLAGRGQYLGTVLSVTMAQDGWFGEGDDFFYIDGEEVPSLQGTGSEDYFNDAWGFRPRTSHWFGSPRWQGDNAGDSGVCYRWHLPDPVHFSKSLKVAIEHKGNRAEDTEGFYLERPDSFSSVAFWYQEGEPKPFFRLPPWPERRVPWEQHHFVRAFRQAQTTGEAKVQVDTSGLFGARPVLLWPNKTADAVLTLPFEVKEEGRYAVRLTAGNGPDYGGYDIEIDGRKVLGADFRAPEPSELDLLLGTHVLAKGNHTISFRAAAANSDRSGPLAVEMLRLLKLPPEAKREVRTHNEAHFIRLGIGRAVYAYRLAYGQLPDSLQTLVDARIMSARYLNDENNQPLRSRREGDYLVVESTGPDGWTHRWQGLDARR